MNIILKKELHIESELLKINVPHNFLGKDVEIIIKEKDMKDEGVELDEFFSRFNYDLSGLEFNRDELYIQYN